MTIDLIPDQLGELLERFGSLPAAAVWAIRSGPYAEDLARHGATVAEGLDGPYMRLSDWERESLIWRLIYASHVAAPPAAPDLPGVPAASPKPPLPNPTQLNSYTHGTLEKAVKQFAKDDTPGDVVQGAKRAKMPRPDALRVRALWRGKLLYLSEGGKLLIDKRVPHHPTDMKKYVLRYLNATGTAYLDPNKEPPTP